MHGHLPVPERDRLDDPDIRRNTSAASTVGTRNLARIIAAWVAKDSQERANFGFQVC